MIILFLKTWRITLFVSTKPKAYIYRIQHFCFTTFLLSFFESLSTISTKLTGKLLKTADGQDVSLKCSRVVLVYPAVRCAYQSTLFYFYSSRRQSYEHNSFSVYQLLICSAQKRLVQNKTVLSCKFVATLGQSSRWFEHITYLVIVQCCIQSCKLRVLQPKKKIQSLLIIRLYV